MTYQRIMVPLDGSPTSNLGLREAMRLAQGQRASLHLVHVVDRHFLVMSGLEAGVYTDQLLRDMTQYGRRILRKAEALVKSRRLKYSAALLETFSGSAADLIVREARKARADLVVIGTHGRRGVRRLLLGSDAEQIVRNSPVPVLLVRATK